MLKEIEAAMEACGGGTPLTGAIMECLHKAKKYALKLQKQDEVKETIEAAIEQAATLSGQHLSTFTKMTLVTEMMKLRPCREDIKRALERAYRSYGSVTPHPDFMDRMIDFIEAL